jgi:hypothetical protein
MMVALEHIRHLILKFQVQVLVAVVVLEVLVFLQGHIPVALDKVVAECNYLQHLEIQNQQ